MQREPRAFLWDIRSAVEAIAEFARAKSLADYQSDLLLRSAIERQLIVLGEALAQLAKLRPDLADRIRGPGIVCPASAIV